MELKELYMYRVEEGNERVRREAAANSEERCVKVSRIDLGCF